MGWGKRYTGRGDTAHTFLRGEQLGWGHRTTLTDPTHSRQHLHTLQTPTNYSFLAMSNIHIWSSGRPVGSGRKYKLPDFF